MTVVDISDLEYEDQARQSLAEMFAVLDESTAKADELMVRLFESISDTEKRRILLQYQECRDAHIEVSILIHAIKQSIRFKILQRQQLIDLDMADRRKFLRWRDDAVRQTFELHGEAMMGTLGIMFVIIMLVLWGAGQL